MAPESVKLKVPDPFVFNICPFVPSETFNSVIPTVLVAICALPTVPVRSPPTDVPVTLVLSVAN